MLKNRQDFTYEKLSDFLICSYFSDSPFCQYQVYKNVLVQ